MSGWLFYSLAALTGVVAAVLIIAAQLYVNRRRWRGWRS